MSAAESSQSISEHLEREPDLEQARRAALMAHQAVVKLKKMGMPDEMDEPLSRFCVDLGDVWSAQTVLAKQIEAFLKSPDDWSEMGDRVADIQLHDGAYGVAPAERPRAHRARRAVGV